MVKHISRENYDRRTVRSITSVEKRCCKSLKWRHRDRLFLPWSVVPRTFCKIHVGHFGARRWHFEFRE